MILIISGTLPSLNEVINANRSNRFAGAKMKKSVQSSIEKLVMQQCLYKYERIRISFEWYEKNRKRDFDNIASSAKFILDALVKCKVIPNDGWKQIAPELNHKFYHDKENPRVVVTIIPIED